MSTAGFIDADKLHVTDNNNNNLDTDNSSTDTNKTDNNNSEDNTCIVTTTSTVSDTSLLYYLPPATTCYANSRHHNMHTVTIRDEGSAAILDWYTHGDRTVGNRWDAAEYYQRTTVYHTTTCTR